MECSLMDRLENNWKKFKSKLLHSTLPRSALHKTAKSFRPVTLLCGGVYYNVNNSTFAEWCDHGIGLLVNLLVL